MAARVLLKLHSPGMAQVLVADGVKAEVERVADQVADNARERASHIVVGGERAGESEGPIPVTSMAAHGNTRARAIVMLDHAAGIAVEAKHRVLGGALG